MDLTKLIIRAHLLMPGTLLVLGLSGCNPQESPAPLASAQTPAASASAQQTREAMDRYCVACHNDSLKTAGLSLDHVDVANVAENQALLEKVVTKLRTGTMPPPNIPGPTGAERQDMIASLETSLDAVAAANPNPGRTETLRRLNRSEYQNAIRDLLALEIDATTLLPPDESGYGFDNVNVGDLSPALLDRYISAAQKISRLAVGGTQASLQSELIDVPPDLTQEEHIAGLPIGTRGGVSVAYTFPQDGEYDIQVKLARNRTGNIGGLSRSEPQSLELPLIDKLSKPSR